MSDQILELHLKPSSLFVLQRQNIFIFWLHKKSLKRLGWFLWFSLPTVKIVSYIPDQEQSHILPLAEARGLKGNNHKGL